MTRSGRLPIFDSTDRSSQWPRRHGESTFRFFNRIAGDFWEQQRALLQSWADGLQMDTDYRAIRSNLRSADDYEAQSAYLELYLYEILRRNVDSIEVHPALENHPRHPDFLAHLDNGPLYLECIAPAVGKATKSAAARIEQFYAVIDEAADPDFHLWIDEVNDGPNPIAASKLRRQLRGWLDDLRAQSPDSTGTGRPKFRWQQGEWSGTFTVFRRGNSLRGDEFDRGIGGYPVEAAFFNDAPKIRKALAEKDKAYGELGAPFVIAIGMQSFDRDLEDVTRALWGDGIEVDREREQTQSGVIPPRWNGYFGAPGAWNHTQVSAVLIVNELYVHNPTVAAVSLWKHPGAQYPLTADFRIPGITVQFTGTVLTAHAGTDSHEFFDLPADWPAGDPWPWKNRGNE